MKRAKFLSLILAAVVVSSTGFLQAQAPRVIAIEGSDMMKFSVTSITARPGEQLTVRLTTVSKMPKLAMAHNFVLLRAGADPTAFANAAAMAGATGYIPAARKGDVLESTALAGAGETVEVTFKAPAAAGTYTFLCSFPGHFAAGMRGTLVVK
jgi:azurin